MLLLMLDAFLVQDFDSLSLWAELLGEVHMLYLQFPIENKPPYLNQIFLG
jgi:hypothetical protein